MGQRGGVNVSFRNGELRSNSSNVGVNREPWQLRPRLKPHIVVGSKCDQAFCVCFQREARFERLRIDMATDLRPPGTRPERPKRGEEVSTPSVPSAHLCFSSYSQISGITPEV